MCVCVCVYVCVFVCARERACVHAYLRVCACVGMRILVCLYVYVASVSQYSYMCTPYLISVHINPPPTHHNHHLLLHLWNYSQSFFLRIAAVYTIVNVI